MSTEIKDGDLYSYATIHVESHGFMVRANHEFMYEIELSDWLGVELKVNPAGHHHNVSVRPDQINKMTWDDRNRNGSSGYVLVYRSGKSEAEVLEMLRPQLQEHLITRKKAYATLVLNADEMLAALDVPMPSGDYLCANGFKS